MTASIIVTIRDESGHLYKAIRGVPVIFKDGHLLTAIRESLDGGIARDKKARAENYPHHD